MGTKTITITEDAYKKLKVEKMEGESFSELIDRLTDGSRKDLMEFAGAWKLYFIKNESMMINDLAHTKRIRFRYILKNRIRYFCWKVFR
jgi:predicted CopG family antitoxin